MASTKTVEEQITDIRNATPQNKITPGQLADVLSAMDAEVMGKTEKVRIDIVGTTDSYQFKRGDEVLNFAALNNLLQNTPAFCVFVHGKREHRCTIIDLDSNPKQMRFVAPLLVDGRLKTQSIYVTSNNGTDITSITINNINSENSDNKVTNIETYKASNDKYPTVKAVFDWCKSLFLDKNLEGITNTGKEAINGAAMKGEVGQQLGDLSTEVSELHKTVGLEYNYDSTKLDVGSASNNVIGDTIEFDTLTTFYHGVFDCEEGDEFTLSTKGGSGTAKAYAFLDGLKRVISNTTKVDLLDEELTAPVNAKFICVNCATGSLGSFALKKVDRNTLQGRMKSVEEYKLSYEDAPQIYNNQIRRRDKSEGINIALFGSSWFVCTWWYLNKMLASVGIHADIYAHYIGGASFDQWINKYNDDTAISRWYSMNGSDWERDSASLRYTLESQKWDLIGFQQGTYESIQWEQSWKPYIAEIVSIVKRNCRYDTTIAFNSTYTPPVQGTLAPFTNKRDWQAENYKNCKKFMTISGINNVAANGAMLWAMRADAAMNISKDMADDGLHPNNGLPCYGLALMFFHTYFSPMFGVDISEITWRPTEDTQKNMVSANSFQPVTQEDFEKLVKMVKLASSDRFGFRDTIK